MQPTIKKLKSALEPIYGKGESDAIIRLIFHYLKGWNFTDMVIHSADTLSPFIRQEIDSILERLLEHEPIQYITGEARFFGMDFSVRPGVLIPRPETEQLVDLIIDENKGKTDLRVLDLCTGSGCIAVSLARSLPFSRVTAIEISNVAMAVAIENAKRLKATVNFVRQDVFDYEPSEFFDIIVSNPPYVLDSEALEMERNVLDYEPHEALFVRNENPLVFYDRIADIATRCLSNLGKLYLEINPKTVSQLHQLLQMKGFININVYRDSFGRDRFLSACLSD